jgi:hypothetical protein
MNGEHKEIYDVINDMRDRLIKTETLQAERHAQNRKDMNGLGDITRSVEKHCHEIGKLKVHRAIHWVILGAIAAALIIT